MGSPYPAPPAGAPLRLAFVGQRTFFEACALGGELRELRTAFFEFRKGGDADRLLAELAVFAPHVVVVFRPEIVPAGCFAGLRAATLGWLTEPIPRGTTRAHADQQRRLWELRQVDAANFDRVVSFDPLIADTAGSILDVWRSVALPVADRYFMPVRPVRGRPRALFVGRSTPHREYYLTPVKHRYDVLHMAFGVDAAELERLLAEHEVGINLHNEPYPSFENRVPIHLAAGHLVISEPLSPLHGLEPGVDFLELVGPALLGNTLEVLSRFPGAYDRIRVRGRRKAELFRASRVYPRLVGDLLRELESGETPRAA
ncbi:MAG: hypothetical protein E6G10_22735 [Actinobacteria bacterium]|nr:MAG: hypothetical protein E6G10_22735 [Actinomycetota bacterium]